MVTSPAGKNPQRVSAAPCHMFAPQGQPNQHHGNESSNLFPKTSLPCERTCSSKIDG